MPTLNIGGQRIKVGDEFLQLSPEQRNAAVEEIARSLLSSRPPAGASAQQNPRAVGEAVSRQSGRERDRTGHPEFDASNIKGYNPETGTVEQFDKTGSAIMGAADMMSLGLGDELGAGAMTVRSMLPGGDGQGYSENLDEIRRGYDRASGDNPWSYMGGMGAGALAGGYGLAKAGLSAAGNAISRGASLGRVAMASALDGGVLGALTGFNSGEGTDDRIKKGTIGGAVGGAAGLAAPYAMAGVSAAAKALSAPVMARLRPNAYADSALGGALLRAGKSADDVATELQAARLENQPGFAVADALGLTGQRLSSTAARVPHEGRQEFVEALHARQSGQGRRITNALAEAFDAPDTAAQRSTTMTAARDAAADVAYGQARRDAGPVDVSPVIKAIDDVIQPGVHGIARPNNNIAYDTIEGALARVKSMITDGKSNITDFNAVFRTKLDLDDMIQKAEAQGAGNRANALGKVQKILDDALAKASKTYAGARDEFAAASRRIEAVDKGKSAATRGRTEDTTAAFDAMTPEEQAAFRAGYADPLISQTQGAAVGVDKSRPLISDATGVEFARFPEQGSGKGARLWRQLGREKTMFETRNAATGGSRTADNLADMADASGVAPEVMNGLMRGRLTDIAVSAVARALSEAQGMPPSVVSRVAKALLETDPAAAKALLSAGQSKTAASTGRRATVNAVANALSGLSSGRLPTP